MEKKKFENRDSSKIIESFFRITNPSRLCRRERNQSFHGDLVQKNEALLFGGKGNATSRKFNTICVFW